MAEQQAGRPNKIDDLMAQAERVRVRQPTTMEIRWLVIAGINTENSLFRSVCLCVCVCVCVCARVYARLCVSVYVGVYVIMYVCVRAHVWLRGGWQAGRQAGRDFTLTVGKKKREEEIEEGACHDRTCVDGKCM